MCSSNGTGSCATYSSSPERWSCCQEPGHPNACLGLCCQPGFPGERSVPALPLDLASSRGCCQLLAAGPVKSSRIDHVIVNENHKQADTAKPCNCTNWGHRHERAKSHSPGLRLVILLTSCFSTSTTLHKADPPAMWT